MRPNPIATATRHARRTQRYGEHAACVRCGISALETLVPLPRRFLERHHVCGKANDPDLTVPVCRNCHAILTEGQNAAGVTFTTPPTVLHQIAAALCSLFSMLHDLSEVGMTWAHALTNLADELDIAFPEWRKLQHAQAIGGTV